MAAYFDNAATSQRPQSVIEEWNRITSCSNGNIHRAVHALADEYGDKLKFAALNTSKARRVAIGQKVMGLPVIAVYKDGEKIEELVKDDATPEAVKAMVEKYV